MAIERPRILAVDDDPLVTKLIRLYLWDYDISIAGSGAHALSLLTSWRPALILLDVQMPGMDGLQALELIRRRPHLASSPVMMLTAEAGRPTISGAMTGGANGYMLKPFTRHTLVRRVNRILQGSPNDAVHL